MNIVRKVETVALDIATVDSVNEAKTVMDHVLGGKVTDKASRNAANGLVEAFFVTYLASIPKDKGALLNALNDLKGTFGEYNPFRRAVERCRAQRGKNPAWKTFKHAG